MKMFYRFPIWLAAWLLRGVLIAYGLILVPFTLLGHGSERTPRLWRWFGSVETIPSLWNAEDVEWWMYFYIPLVIVLAGVSYNNWHPLITIYFIFASIGSLLVIGNSRFYKFWWMAIRNPLEGLDSLLTQPVPETHPNPDRTVRVQRWKKDSRFMQHGIFWEYWSLRRMKNGKYWEFRIGWKFVDGNDDFVPTFQLGPKK